jgi:V8-like Glu-specific endopeptidase
MFRQLFTIPLIGLFSLPLFAVTHSKISTAYPAAVKIENEEGLYCTGEVVGLHPTTVVTAAHCLLEHFNLLKGKEPTAALTLSKNESQESKDVAVLIYGNVNLSQELSEQQLFSVAPLPRHLGETLLICGYGSTSTMVANDGTQSESLRCGQNALSAVDGKSTPIQAVQAPYSNQDLQYLQTIFQQEGSKAFNLIVSVADGSILGPHVDEKVNINGGDSGGPWFSEDAQGLHLTGISSWGADIGGRLVASIAVNLNSSDARLTLQSAVKEKGADIRGIKELLQSSGE